MHTLQNYLKNKGVNLMTQTTDSSDDRYHSHLFFEVFYITSKSILHEANGKKSLMSVGDICFLRPADSHIFHRKFNDDCVHRDILLSAELVKKACNYLDSSFYKIFTDAPQPFTFKLSQNEFNRFNEEFADFSDLQAKNIEVNLSYRENYLAVLLFHSLFEKLQNYSKTTYPNLIQNLISDLNDNKQFVKSLSEILDSYNYNKSYISRVFSKYMGLTVSQYFINARVLYSVKLLHFTQMPIAEIAIASGFATITYYDRVFNKQFGMSPTEYRRNLGSELVSSPKQNRNGTRSSRSQK